MKTANKLICLLISIFIISCNNKSDKNCLVLRSLYMPTTNNIISLKKDTISNKYFLKDNYNLYVLNSYFLENNIIYNGGELKLLKDTYSNNSTGNGFVIEYFTRDYLSYTFLEYQKKKLMVRHFIEIVNTDDKIVDELKELTDTISKLSSKKVDLGANTFFTKYIAFNTLKNDSVNYNYLNRKDQWLVNSKSRQEKWATTHFLYEGE